MKYAVTTLFNEFIRISPRKIIKFDKDEEKLKSDNRLRAFYNGVVMNVGELYIKIGESYVKIPEKALYKVMDIPGNDEMQSMQYFIRILSEILRNRTLNFHNYLRSSAISTILFTTSSMVI